MVAPSPELFPLPFFDGEVVAELDDAGRLALVQYVEDERPAQYVELVHDERRGTFSDESYCAQNYARGHVEELHLGELASEAHGVAFDAWIERAFHGLLTSVAATRITWLLEDEDGDATVPDAATLRRYLRSYERLLEITGTELAAHGDLIQLGWAICALALDERVERARDVFRDRYAGQRDRLEDHDPLVRALVGSRLSPRFWARLGETA